MAIWQFPMVFIPQQKHDINFDSIYSEDGYDVSQFWNFFNKKLELIEEIGALLARNPQRWDETSFHWGDDKKTDINLSINEQDGRVENFIIRIDVREQFDLVFIEKVIKLASKYNLQLLNIREREIIELNVGEIHKVIKNSKAYRFRALFKKII